MVYIILMFEIRAGSVSVMSVTLPWYMGSRLFSNVARYLTLSLASFAASVTYRLFRCQNGRAQGGLHTVPLSGVQS